MPLLFDLLFEFGDEAATGGVVAGEEASPLA